MSNSESRSESHSGDSQHVQHLALHQQAHEWQSCRMRQIVLLVHAGAGHTLRASYL